MKAIQMKTKTSLEGEPLVSEEDFSCCPGGREVEMDKGHFEGESTSANSPSEGSAESCRSKSSKTSITIKPCKVLLKHVDCELKTPHKYCLRPPKTKKFPQKVRNTKKFVSFKMLQAGLYDLLNRHQQNKTPGTPQNPATLPENKKVIKMESGLVLSSSGKILSKETNADNDIEKAEREASVEHGKMLTEETERRESSPRTDLLGSKCSGEAPTDCSCHSSRINMIPICPGETLQTSKTNYAGSFTLPLLSEFEPYLDSSLPGSFLEEDLKNEFPRENTVKIPVEGRRNQNSIQSSADIVIREQVTAEKTDALNQARPTSQEENDGSCWLEFERKEVVNIGGPVHATYELSQEMQNGDHSRDVPPSGCRSLSGDAADSQHSEGRIETVLNGRESSNAEEHGSSQPAEESLAEVEDQLLRLQSHGVQIVFYELSGSTVKLLGTPRDGSVIPSLDRPIELEDSSDSEESSGSMVKPFGTPRGSSMMLGLDRPVEPEESSGFEFLQYQEGQGSRSPLNKENEGSPCSTELTRHQPLCTDNTRAIKRSTWSTNRRLSRICSSELSEEESRIKVVDALREVLQKRLDDSPDLSVQEDTVLRVAKKVEKALFRLSSCVDQQYKNKYRSLLFNLKSAKNQQLFCKVILGEISPKRLVQMNVLELAPEDLAEWRARERKHALEVIEKEEREAPSCCLTKFTHKGIVEIHREIDEDLIFQEIYGSQLLEDENSHRAAPAPSMRSCRDNHDSHMSDFNCFSDPGQMAADSEGGFKPPTYKHTVKQKTNVSTCLQSNTVYSGRGERQLQEDNSATSSSIPKKHLRVGNQSGISIIWKGLIQMFSLKQFAAKAFAVSGSGHHLFKALPDLLQSRGCILPEDVWAYLDSIWPANAKEMALIRFQPRMMKQHSSYNMLHAYLNNKQRYGIVDSSQMEIFMVPLAAYQPVPSRLHPLGGPGLDPCHPSLLLGLILPKRPAPSPPPLPKTKRKIVTFKDSIEIQYFPPPSQVDACQMQPLPPLSLSEPLSEHGCSAVVLPRHEPPLSEEPVSEVVCEGLSLLQNEMAGGGTSQSLLDVALQLQFDSPWMLGQLGNVTLETLRAQSQQAEICSNPDPLYIGNPLLPSEAVCPNHRGMDGAYWANPLDSSHLLNVLCPEGVLPVETSEALLPPQIPSATPAAGDTNSVVEETVSLIHYVTQLQSHIAPNQESLLQYPSPAVNFSGMPPEIASVLSPVVAGLGLPAVQQSDANMHAQLQLLLSSLQGQTQPPST